MAEARRLDLAQVRIIVSDGDELAKGARVMDEGGLQHLARFENKLFADASGSGASPYKVQIHFDDKAGVRGRCSCMAARSRPFCKHACGLLVAWARAPESFAESAGPPAGSAGEAAKKKTVKTGKVEARDLMGRGVEQVDTLLRELTVAGVAALAADRAAQVQALGETLREARLRRLSARTQELADHLGRAASRSVAFEAVDYTELMADMLLTVRKLQKHLQGEELAEELVEELIGRTWTKKDRRPIEGLGLVEYAYLTRTTADEFHIRECRYFDLETGQHYSQKQILPGFLVRRTEPLKSRAGRLLGGTSGSLYPSYAPRRLDLEATAADTELGAAALARFEERSLASVAAALAALQERRKDVFAPDTLPVALRVDSVLAEGARLQIVDASGAALFLPDDAASEEALAGALREGALRGLVGDVALDGALPTLFPLAVLVCSRGRLQLLSLAGLDPSAQLELRRSRSRSARAQAEQAAQAAAEAARATRWVEVARRAGVSPSAIALGEVREEMAEALALGLASVVPRWSDPLVSRLRDLGLAKQADLLATIATRSDPVEKLDDFIKLHQVLGIALARLTGSTQVDRSTLEVVPTYESVYVRRPERVLVPREVMAERAAGRLSRYEAAVHQARHYGSLSIEELGGSIFPLWADGAASPHVARALARSPGTALEAAERTLDLRRPCARVARLTAIRILEAIGNDAARRVLAEATVMLLRDRALAAHVRRALDGLDGVGLSPERAEGMRELVATALGAPQREERISALEALAEGAFVEAIPALRASFVGDVSTEVRTAAAFALARVGDVESVEAFVRLLRQRDGDGALARVGARALGMLGDARGLDELLAAYGDGWQPGVIAEALREFGPAALHPVVSLLEARPELAARKAALGVLAALPAEEVASHLCARLQALGEAPDFCERALLLLTVASPVAFTARAVASRIIELRTALNAPAGAKLAAGAERALAKKCATVLKG